MQTDWGFMQNKWVPGMLCLIIVKSMADIILEIKLRRRMSPRIIFGARQLQVCPQRLILDDARVLHKQFHFMIKLKHIIQDGMSTQKIEWIKQHICVVCGGITPIQTAYTCNHYTCQQCTYWGKCPIDGNPTVPSPSLRSNSLTYISVKCPYATTKCKWFGSYQELANHETYCVEWQTWCLNCKQIYIDPSEADQHQYLCSEKFIKCNCPIPHAQQLQQYNTCGKVLQRKAIQEHLTKDCLGLCIFCLKCTNFIQQALFFEHAQSCFAPTCPNEHIGCTIKEMSPEQQEIHHSEGCGFDRVPCTICGCLYLRKDKLKHIQVYCEQLSRTREYFIDCTHAFTNLMQIGQKIPQVSDTVYKQPTLDLMRLLKLQSKKKRKLFQFQLRDEEPASQLTGNTNLVNPIMVKVLKSDPSENEFIKDLLKEFNLAPLRKRIHKTPLLLKSYNAYFQNYRNYLAFRIVLDSCSKFRSHVITTKNPRKVDERKVFFRAKLWRDPQCYDNLKEELGETVEFDSLNRGRTRVRGKQELHRQKCGVIVCKDKAAAVSLMQRKFANIRLSAYMMDHHL